MAGAGILEKLTSLNLLSPHFEPGRKVALFGRIREFLALAERPSTAAATGNSGVTAELFLEFGHAPFEVRVLRNAYVERRGLELICVRESPPAHTVCADSVFLLAEFNDRCSYPLSLQ
jgi:hypothetical protein